MPTPTLHDVCKLAGTSDATASMILNGGQAYRFRPEIRERVQRAAKELGYVPQRAGQTLRTGKSYNIAVLLNGLENPFFARYASLLQSKLLKHNYTTIPLQTLSMIEREQELLHWLLQRNIDGVVDLQGMLRSPREYHDLAQHSALVIRSTQPLPEGFLGHLIHVDYSHGLRLLAEHLAQMGCRRPGVLAVPAHLPHPHDPQLDSSWTRDCQKTFSRVNIPIDPVHWFDGGLESQMQSWYEAARSLARAPMPVDALLVHNAAVVPAVLQGLSECGVRVGQDLALATFDDPAELTYQCGGVTSVREPVDLIAQRLADALIDRIAALGQPVVRQTLMTELVVRNSTSSFVARRWAHVR